MAPIPPIKPVLKTPAGLPGDYKIPDYWYEIEYNGRILKYTLDIIGNQPPRDTNGYPLYIAMHGGGANNDGGRANDSEWWTMYTSWYKTTVAKYYANPPPGSNWTPNGAAVYVTIRGVSTGPPPSPGGPPTDEWNLHSRPEGQVLVERLIVHLITSRMPSEFSDHPRRIEYIDLLNRNYPQNFIDSDRVFLLGFSAGGNGAFELGTRLSDRFAAIVPAAGHPESAFLVNLANVQTFLQVGEDDAWPYTNGDVGFHRAQVYLSKANYPLDAYKSKDEYKNYPSLYTHECTVVKNADRIAYTRQNELVHNYWSNPGHVFTQPMILNKESFQDWLEKFKNQTISGKLPEMIQGMPSDAYRTGIVDPIGKIALLKRKFEPSLVVWDLRGRTEEPDFNDPKRTWEPQRYSYWLYLRRPITSYGPDYQPEWAWCDYTAGHNDLHIERPNDYIAYLLEQGYMLNLGAPIRVYIAGSKNSPQTLTVTQSEDIMNVTQAARGDTRWQFQAMIYLEKSGDDWTAKSAKTMAEVEPKNPAA